MNGAWQEFLGTGIEWDFFVTSMPRFDVRHCFAWGESVKLSGRDLRRLVCVNSQGKIVTAIQFSVKKFPFGGTFFYADGGAVGGLSTIADVREHLTKIAGNQSWLLRSFFTLDRAAGDVAALHEAGFDPALSVIHSGLSATLHFSDNFSSLKETASGNWRHNLTRGRGRISGVELWANPSVSAIIRTYQEFEAGKGVAKQFADRTIEGLVKGLNNNLVVCRALDSEGNILSLRGAAILGSRGLDIFAATTPKGRESYASQVVTDELLKACFSRGVRVYDFGGIDPRHGKGVYTLKSGTGAVPSEYLGEWDLAPRNVIRLAANFMFFLRKRRV